jgi:DNA protecting protein DprA
MRLIHSSSEIRTRRYRSTGEGAQSAWSVCESPGGGEVENPLFPPPPGLIQKLPPQELFIRGRADAFELLAHLPEFGFAVVGTRNPQARSRALVRSRLRSLEGTRLIVLSGLALGIDAAAHEAALTSRLPTIAILGSPLDEIYPPENRSLADRIVQQGGLLVTEFASGVRIERHFFLLRNRLIAGWAKATWIVEAGFRSGALNTASWSWDHDRDTYATPSFPGDPSYTGCTSLIYREKALAFWEPDSLHHTWPQLRNLGHRGRIHPMPKLWDSSVYNDGGPFSDAQSLKKEVSRATLRQGGASVEFLLDWALAHQWNPQRFFEALQLCLNERQIEDRGGVLSSFGLSGDRG